MIRLWKNRKKPAAWLLAGLMAMSAALSACGNGGGAGETQGGASSGPSSQAATPESIRIMSQFFGATPPAADNPVELKIEEATNTKLDIEWVSANNYKDKFNVTLASGDIPDLILVANPSDPVFRKAAEQGAFWDVAPYIDQYPNLKDKIAPIAWEMTSIKGANYGVPRPRPVEGEAFYIIRKDWLENVGLPEPTTPEQLYEVMKAFTTQDPDGNGQNDTIGLAGQADPDGMGLLAEVERMFNRAYGEWKLQEDGTLVNLTVTPETRESLVYLTNAYREGLIPLDFASLKLSQVKDMFKAGKAGILVEKAGAMQEYYEALKATVPDLAFTDLYPLTNVNEYNPKGSGYSGLNAIPKTVSEDKMKRILAMLDSWSADGVFKLHQQGIEGIHHTLQNGEAVLNAEKITADAIGEYSQIVYVADPYASSVKVTFPDEAKELYKKIQDEREKTSVENVGAPLVSETGQSYLPEFRKTVQDLKTKVILGQKTIEDWDAFVASLASNETFKKMTEEINEAYKNK